jgi:exodeoxyribonuclease-3
MVKIATWNVNSVRPRLPILLDWLGEVAPDVVLLQEIKATDETFPRLEIEDRGYNVAIAGQKTYNGVAVLSKAPIEVDLTALPGNPEDDQARYIEAFTGGVRAASVYLPNGNPTDGPKYPYKLAWMERLHAHVRTLLAGEDAFVLGGDYNVCPDDGDVYDPEGWRDDALCRPESRQRFRALVYEGFTDAFRAFHPEPHLYSFWDYQAGRWQKDQGLRIDHLLLSPQAADRLADSDIDRGPRSKEKPSDHTPVWCDLED